MTPDGWRRVKRAFDHAVDHAPGTSRDEAIAAACGDDAELRGEVERLLREHDGAGGFLEQAPPGGGSVSSLFDELEPALASDAAVPPVAEEVIGRYRIVERLGQGGQGMVYLAVDEECGRHVALKVLTRLGALSPVNLARFEREARVCRRLEHPGLCQVYGAGSHEGVPYIAMQHVEGETLASRLRSGPAPVGEMLAVIGKTARALQAAHDSGVVHRDVKPGNIMITPDGEPVAVDFGLARDLETESPAVTGTGDLLGTPSYMAPEQIDPRRGMIDGRTDVYSLGATLYEAVTGRRPFEGTTREAIYQSILTQDAPDPRRHAPSLSADLAAVLETALEKEPGRRYQSAGDLADDLARLERGDPVRARPVSSWRRLRRTAWRHPAATALVVTVALAIVTAFALVAAGKHRAERDRDDIERLSDARRLRQLAERAEELWPARPERAAAMAEWLEDARAIRGRRRHHERFLSELRASARRDASGGLLLTDEQAWAHELLLEIIGRFDELDRLMDDVRSRLDFARTIGPRSLVEHAAAWHEATAAVARAPAYGGLALEPQLGLVPLGRDPESGLFEFLHLETHRGPVPPRDAGGRLAFGADTGIVFVLVPGGTFTMGAGWLGDPLAQSRERPPHEVELEAFFISKYEMSCAQWARTVTRARWARTVTPPPPPAATRSAAGANGDHPVGEVSWTDAARAMARLGLALPTEAQWEYAARGGTSTVWWTGDDVESLRGAANLSKVFRWPPGDPGARALSLDDGFDRTAPVATLRANPFGLHHVHGNVWEWCRDGFGAYDLPVRPGDGERVVEESDSRVYRGGGFSNGPQAARSSNRFVRRLEYLIQSLGLRPARAVES